MELKYLTDNANNVMLEGEFYCRVEHTYSHPDFSTGRTQANTYACATLLAAALNDQEAASKAPEQVPLYRVLSETFEAYKRCQATPGHEWANRHGGRIHKLCFAYMPSGAGWDNGTSFDFDASRPDHLVFTGAYHHMVEGTYDGWTSHKVIVRPSLSQGIYIRITGRNRDDVKAYLHDVFSEALHTLVDPKTCFGKEG